jgi:hypothetical protein
MDSIYTYGKRINRKKVCYGRDASTAVCAHRIAGGAFRGCLEAVNFEDRKMSVFSDNRTELE